MTWDLDAYYERIARCTCGAAEHANAFVTARTVRRYIEAMRDVYVSDGEVSIRDAWRATSMVRQSRAENDAAIATWHKRAERRRYYAFTLHPRLREKVLTPGVLCAYGCGNPARTVDHIVPRAQGGRDGLRNLSPACRSCNSRKSSRTPEQWRAGEPPAHCAASPLPRERPRSLQMR